MGVNMEEIWKDIEGYEGLYMVSSHGRVWSRRYNLIMKPILRGNYLSVTLFKDKKSTKTSIHRLVAYNFLNEIKGKNYVNHIDEDKVNNKASNLEWVTHTENINHGTRTEKAKQTMKTSIKYRNGIKTRAKMLSMAIVGVDPNNNKIYFNSQQDAKRSGFDQRLISRCINGKTRTHKGYKWYKQSEFEQKENERCI